MWDIYWLVDVSSGVRETVMLNCSCPHLEVGMAGVTVPRLVDIGSMVSTITWSFFHKHFESSGQDRHQPFQWLEPMYPI